MQLIAACGEKQKRPRKTFTRDYARESERYNYRYRHDPEFRELRRKLARENSHRRYQSDPEFRAYRQKLARDRRRKEKMKEASQ